MKATKGQPRVASHPGDRERTLRSHAYATFTDGRGAHNYAVTADVLQTQRTADVLQTQRTADRFASIIVAWQSFDTKGEAQLNVPLDCMEEFLALFNAVGRDIAAIEPTIVNTPWGD